MMSRILVPLLFITCGLAAVSCRSIENYTDPDEPLFEGSYAGGTPVGEENIVVITWNIAFAEEVEQAIEELAENQDLADADILLLQEMDETGVEEMARSLEYNYVYFPASIHSHHDRNFGNAILSKWPLSDPEKLILPHKNPRNGQIRIAAKAVADIAGTDVHIYSVHTETNWLGTEERQEQINAILADLPDGEQLVIVGGDFNTLTPGSMESLAEQFEQAGLSRGGSEAGPTIGVGSVGLTLDHMFSRGLSEAAAGVWSEAKASDHNPLWVRYILD